MTMIFTTDSNTVTVVLLERITEYSILRLFIRIDGGKKCNLCRDNEIHRDDRILNFDILPYRRANLGNYLFEGIRK